MAAQKTWNLVTPYGTILCRKGRSYGEKLWRRPETDKSYKSAYFDDKGNRLSRDVYAYVNGKWIPSKGDNTYLPRMTYAEWLASGKPKSLEGRKLGLVVKKIMMSGKTTKAVEGSQDLTFKATKSIQLSQVEMRRMVTEDAKYIIPMPESVPVYKQAVNELRATGSLLITNPVQISTRSSIRYIYGILPYDRYLIMVELLNEELGKPFPPDALIPSEEDVEVGDIEEEGDELI